MSLCTAGSRAAHATERPAPMLRESSIGPPMRTCKRSSFRQDGQWQRCGQGMAPDKRQANGGLVQVQRPPRIQMNLTFNAERITADRYRRIVGRIWLTQNTNALQHIGAISAAQIS
eukprot:349824-Chlamydomonas_euryale.AAC.8